MLGKFGESFLNFEHINAVRRSFGHVTVARNKRPIGDKLLRALEASDLVNLIENRQGQDLAGYAAGRRPENRGPWLDG